MNWGRAAWPVVALLVGGTDGHLAFGAPRPAASPAAEAPAAPAYAWEEKFFVAPPRELLAVGKGADDPAASTVVLFEERVHTFDADGRHRSRNRYVYKILTEAALDDDSFGSAWSPWHEAEPKIRARVVTRDGKAYVLDPKTIETSGVRSANPSVFTDRRQLRAPLPGLAVGAIVEEEIVRDSQPVLPGLGTSRMFYLGGSLPVRHGRLVLDAPRGLPLHVVERPTGAPLRVTRTETGDRVRLVYETGPRPAAEDVDDGWPDDVPVVPEVHYAVGPAWRDLAARYAELVDRQIAGADLSAWIKEARQAAGGGPRNALIAQLVARLHREVRYTGIEFAEASLVPRRPAEVLARGYGDCKDKAALLVALLRAAGVPAHVALLSVGGLDVDPRLPAIDEFNHAIVHVPAGSGAPALWIDATNPYAPVGELPSSDAGRRALVASPRSDALVTIPAAMAGVSTVRETCRVLLGESGHPRIIERTEAKGAAARGFREAWSTAPRKDLEAHFGTYVKEIYHGKALTRFDLGSPADLSKPLRLELEATDAEIGSVWSEGAEVTVRAGSTLDRLPPTLRAQKDDPARAAGKPRAADFVIAEPFVHELRYEIVPAHGYAADPLPAAETRAIGTASLRSSFSVDAAGVVVASFTFDSGKPRLTPAEFERFRADLKAFWASNAPVIRFHSTGALALSAGKVREALAIFRKLDSEHPRQALHARQLSEAVLAAGLGQVARDEARRALAVDPKNADGERVLGQALEHDLIGRRFTRGADMAGARQAYRRALGIDPKDAYARSALAILLEHDDTGDRSYPPAQLAEADKLYEVLEKEGDKRFVINRTQVLLYLQRFKQVIERVRASSGAGSWEKAALVAAVAATEGTASALREAGSRLAGDEQRGEVMRLAGEDLMHLRRYPEAATFYEQAARDAPKGAGYRVFAEQLRRARRHESVKPDLRQPAQLVRALLIQVILSAADSRLPAPTGLAALVTPELSAELAPSDTYSGVRSAFRHAQRTAAGMWLVPAADLMTETQFDVEGKPGVGYRVRVSTVERGTRRFGFMVRADGEGLRVAGVVDDLGTTGREALRLRKAGRLDAARTWLDWLLESQSLGGATDPLAGSLFARVWSGDEALRSADDVDLAAAVALAESAPAKGAGDALPILQRAHATLAVADSRRVPSALALAIALKGAGKLTEAADVAAEVTTRQPRSLRALHMRLSILHQAGRKAEALRLAEAGAHARPNEPQAIRFLADAQLSLGKVADAEATWTRLATAPRAAAADHNMVAWLRLCRGDVGDVTLSYARRAIELSGGHEAAHLHTLAAVLAERNEPEQARQTLVESLNQRGRDELDEDDRYVLGRIAEALAFPAAARELYGKLARPKPDAGWPEISSYTLAQRRLARLAGGGGVQAAGGAAAAKAASSDADKRPAQR